MKPVYRFPASSYAGLTMLGLLAACSQSGNDTVPAVTPPSPTVPAAASWHVVSGEVFSFDTGMIDGATIRISAVDKNGQLWSYRSESDSDALPVSDGIGRFAARAMLPYPASVTILAEYEGFVQPCGIRMEVDADIDIRVEMMSLASLDSAFPPRPQLSGEPSVTGVIVEATQQGLAPIAGVTVRVDEALPLYGAAGIRVATTQSDRGGGFFLCNLGPDAYLRVSKAGYQNLLIGPVDASASQVVDIELQQVLPPSPGTKLAFVRDGQIYRVNTDGTGLVRLSDGPGDGNPAWSPDGNRIAFSRMEGGLMNIYVMDADGSNLVRRTNSNRNDEPSWSPDGAWIVFAGWPGDSGSVGLYRMKAVDDGTSPIIVIDRRGFEAQPAWSPDGARIAFVSDWDAFDFTSDIFITDPTGSEMTQVTAGFGWGSLLIQYYQPAWSPDGQKFAVVSCPNAYVTCASSTISVLNADGSGLVQLADARGFNRPTWSPDGLHIAFGSSGSIHWVSADGNSRGVIIDDGHSPSWHQ